jgi:PTS system nitrogen regulatory IIA component
MFNMNTVGQLLSPEVIGLNLNISSRKHAFVEAALLLERHHNLALVQVVESLERREMKGSTALGHGMALPHARIKGLDHPIAAYVRAKSTLPFDALDGKRVSDFLVLLLPEDHAEQRSPIIADTVQLLRNWRFRRQLKMCVQPWTVWQLFVDWSAPR